MSLWKRGRQYWADFTVNGRRYRKRLGTTNLQAARQKERQQRWRSSTSAGATSIFTKRWFTSGAARTRRATG
jgi:hypothetical protein